MLKQPNSLPLKHAKAIQSSFGYSVRYAQLNDYSTAPLWASIENQLPEAIIHDLKAQVNAERQKASLVAWNFLQQYILEQGLQGELLQQVVKQAGGKPEIMNGKVFFNFSNSQQLVVAAFSNISPVGVDVEQLRPLRSTAIIQKFTAEEQKYLANQASLETAFYQLWTRKEAYVKRFGHSIFHGLNISVVGSVVSSELGTATLYPLTQLPEGYVGCVAI